MIDMKNAQIPDGYRSFAHDYRPDLTRFIAAVFDLPASEDQLRRIVGSWNSARPSGTNCSPHSPAGRTTARAPDLVTAAYLGQLPSPDARCGQIRDMGAEQWDKRAAEARWTISMVIASGTADLEDLQPAPAAGPDHRVGPVDNPPRVGMRRRFRYTLPGAWVAVVFVCLSFTPSLVPRPGHSRGWSPGSPARSGMAGVVGARVWREFADRPPASASPGHGGCS